jgi:hypothetical protein
MNVSLLSFSLELTKIAASEKKQPSYGSAVVAAAPLAWAQAASDVPKGWLDKSVQQAVSKVPKKLKGKSWKRGVGRAAGRGIAGPVTLPMFLSGIKDIKEGRTAEGNAKILGSAAVYSGGKGGVEALIEHAGTPKLRKALKNLASSRAITGTLAGVATASGIAKSMKGGKKKKKESKSQRFLIPAAVGAVTGGAKGAFDYGWANKKGLSKHMKTLQGRRGMGGAAAGRAVGGVVGGVVLSEVARHAFKKNASDALMGPPTASTFYGQTSQWAKSASTEDLIRQAQMTHQRGADRGPTSRAVYQAMHQEMETRGINSPPPARSTNIPRVDTGIPDEVVYAALAASPMVAWNLAFGKMKAENKDILLNEALDQMIADQGIQRVEAGKNFWGVPNSAYSPSHRAMRLAKDAPPEVIAHELGHAGAGRLRQATLQAPLLQNIARHTRIPTMVLPFFALMGLGDGAFATKEDLEAREDFARGVGRVAVYLHGPALLEEVLAERGAHKILRNMGVGSGEAAKKLLKGSPALAGYAAPIAAPFLAAHLLKKQKERAQ